MKITGIRTSFTPLYVLATGTLGIFLTALVFRWNYPNPGDPKGEAFASVPEFWVWLFLLAILFALLTILFLPAWFSLFSQYKELSVTEDTNNTNTITMLILGVIILFGFMAVFNSVYPAEQLAFREAFPEGHTERMSVIFIYIAIVLLPIILTILLLHDQSQVQSRKIQMARQDEKLLFQIADDLLTIRQSLQNNLLLAGIILSMVPVITAGLRATVIAVDPAYETSMPLTLVFVYGLLFTLLLVFVYVPAHLTLTECSRQLRDSLVPINAMNNSTFQDGMGKREKLDTLLQTNIGIGQNLKAGIITLAPLATSLIVSLLGIDL